MTKYVTYYDYIDLKDASEVYEFFIKDYIFKTKDNPRIYFHWYDNLYTKLADTVVSPINGFTLTPECDLKNFTLKFDNVNDRDRTLYQFGNTIEELQNMKNLNKLRGKRFMSYTIIKIEIDENGRTLDGGINDKFKVYKGTNTAYNEIKDIVRVSYYPYDIDKLPHRE